ncbi:general transcription factor 3C polypeptide 6-like [Ananas comosus]|uniref:General transcription factor 3C polypeptide 6-like n=2 Tax=Ananas comosus TaxID=4615 RepID=A0A6P5EP45_ANACO|nr:general transcription factor 3C polypeptide 6-like [Ananas comosus]XP_020085262.1 general transcription factor 3C polypeptide 6-like [Ananas comosus]XP_020085263.1 general transcription factor 3C polypeptide 6-like [Ananas comosus]XP_020085264.1 general transcription factor 3C polypeptide 6-like [Ananas comosus]CAD1844408.1 unnamed protein product [Ananas comosus var. bracteatus]
MEKSSEHANEEEFLLLDLDDICVYSDIPANAPYTLSGLDTANPTLVIGDRLKLIGEYQETIGTCYIFSEDGETATRNADTRPSETNLINEKHISDSNQASSKQVKPVASLYKALKFKPATDDKNESETTTKCL